MRQTPEERDGVDINKSRCGVCVKHLKNVTVLILIKVGVGYASTPEECDGVDINEIPFLKVAGCTYNSSTIVKVSAEIEFRLKNLVDSSLEISALENIYEEKTRLVKKEYNPLHVLLNIVGNITDRLDNAVEILKRNRDFIQQNYINVTHNTNINSSQCCVSRDLRFDARFNLVEEYKTCFTTAGVSSMDLDTFYQKNLDNSALLLWQYFGDSDGNYHQYPWKARQSVCSSTKTKDHRFK
ncbi:unnamed protein product [Mytilus coruscus]|uniref:Uncharacterized protein n=1 Tax=Mytilus coruscus TaxID=42192 RepID=A0A6J8A8X3_MYTCO|nr:unnamed protein product [Mytilus coruscus]